MRSLPLRSAIDLAKQAVDQKVSPYDGQGHEGVLPIKVKTRRRKAQSIFRYGLDCIRSELFNAFSNTIKRIRKMISLLSPLPPALSAKGLSVTG
jgi:hypothetical protein